MGKLAWTPDMYVGVKEIDEQHAELTGIINELYDAYMENRDYDVLADLINKVNDYAQKHFAAERRYMAPYIDEMPNYEEHMEQHREFFSSAVNFLLEYLEKGSGITPELLDYLTDWWFKHINGTDKVMGAVLKSKGVE
ncbi:hemerythrin family protein [Desulfovibrio mangrovi]|uniref:bacteriohemerythrin n=1 Tax=Desulfovibrio mangrovi TaxID=2976983 RepID=UPI0022484974|nr:hemerythrin family protein [Desulfovibrio mangrovi]UZP67025.1 hemerythrin family protein [Desulfovibrio mangrovi]